MWQRSYSQVYAGIKKETVWRLWADVNHYVEWHDDLEYCKLEGRFEVGNYFMLKPKGAPVFKVTITELSENKRFVDCTQFLGAKMYDIHELEETMEDLKITNTIVVTGWLSFLWTQLVAKKVFASASREMAALVKLARAVHG